MNGKKVSIQIHVVDEGGRGRHYDKLIHHQSAARARKTLINVHRALLAYRPLIEGTEVDTDCYDHFEVVVEGVIEQLRQIYNEEVLEGDSIPTAYSMSTREAAYAARTAFYTKLRDAAVAQHLARVTDIAHELTTVQGTVTIDELLDEVTKAQEISKLSLLNDELGIGAAVIASLGWPQEGNVAEIMSWLIDLAL